MRSGTETTAKGEYLSYRKLIKGRADLRDSCRNAARLDPQDPVPKTMYWNGKGGERFIRPIRWIVALLDDQVVPFEIAGVQSRQRHRGHRILGAQSIPVTYRNLREANSARTASSSSADERRARIEDTHRGSLHVKPDADLARNADLHHRIPDPDPAAISIQRILELPAKS